MGEVIDVLWGMLLYMCSVPEALQPRVKSSREKWYLLNIFVSVLCTYITLYKCSVTCKD